jgi:type II secretory pathway component GspD/PulD (secretin)
MDIVDTIRFLARQADANIVATANVSGRISFFLKNVMVADVLDMIVITNNLARKKKGNITTIMTEAEYERLYGEKYTSMKESEILTLKFTDTDRVKAMLESIKSSIGRVIVDELTGTVLLIDTPKKISEMKQAIERIDIPTIERILPTVTEEFELSYAQAGQIKGEIEAALTEKAGKMRVDERTNKLVVTDLAHNMEKIKSLVDSFDTKTREVFIEAKIVEVTLTDEYAFGIEWERVFSSIANLKDVVLKGTFPTGYTGSSSSSVNIGTLDSHNYTIALDLIEDIGKTKILSSPQMTVLNETEAKFMVGTREAYVTQTISQGDVTTTVAENVEFLDVGVTLFVTPRINKEGFVRMDIKPEVSSIRDWLETSEGNRIPIVETSNLETSVLVKSGHTVVLAGFIKETDAKTRARTPILGKVPLIGNLFRNVRDRYETKELLIFLTPHLTSGDEDASYLVPEERKPRKPPK